MISLTVCFAEKKKSQNKQTQPATAKLSNNKPNTEASSQNKANRNKQQRSEAENRWLLYRVSNLTLSQQQQFQKNNNIEVWAEI